jgi:hypothetical protein
MLFRRKNVSSPWKIYIKYMCYANTCANFSSLILNERHLLSFLQTKKIQSVVFALSSQMNKNILSAVEDVLVSS